jgi:NAD(P)-dependent dehydrogenase (short-subunit alcohol dehydrogenase family)
MKGGSLSERSILITGVSTGIGLSLAKVFAKKNYIVFGSVRKQEDADKVKSEIGQNFIPLIFDVTDHEAIKKSVKIVDEKIGDAGLSGLINNAGIAVSGPLMHLPIDELKHQFDVNIFGTMAVTQAFLPLLGAQKPCPFPPGRIINISSVSGKIAFPFLGAYSASKHALEALSNSLRRELAIYGIDVIIIGPGSVATPIWDKDAAQNIAENYSDTDWKSILERFQKIVVEQGKNGLDANKLAIDIFSVFEKKKFKLRYTFVSHRLPEWIIPRYLFSDKMLDRFTQILFRR